ncbi:MAG: polyprenyl synthetase family protein [Myxococcales bacterium]|nr:polyprenyl synthetase family protein [Myxococcales bacterium]
MDGGPSPIAAAPRQEPLGGDEAIDQVKALMLKLASGDRFERLGAIVQEHLLTGGKRLRARLALAAAESLGVPAEHGVGWAAACELLHNASLIHDDLQDRDELRRGRFSVWVRHGEAQAINAGDLLLMLPYLAVEHVAVPASLKWALALAVARRAEETVRGQSLEMSLWSSCRWDWASYEEAAVGKTSALMTLPVHGAALLAGRAPAQAERLADCFGDLGLLFQMQDDVVDLFGDKGRDKPGGDVREGRVSALVVEHLTQNPEDMEWLCPILGKPREETTDADVARVAEAFEAGALQGVLRRIKTVEARFLEAAPLVAEPELWAVARALTALCLAPVQGLMREVSDA